MNVKKYGFKGMQVREQKGYVEFREKLTEKGYCQELWGKKEEEISLGMVVSFPQVGHEKSLKFGIVGG